MTTRPTMRTMIRARLGDGTAAPLWDDAALNEAIAAALLAYGARLPRERTAAVAVGAGARRLPLPPDAADAARVIRVADPTGRPIPPWRDDPADGGRGQAWRAWDGAISLAEPAAAGAWQVDYLAPRTPPADDATDLDLHPGDEPIAAALAAAFALERRAADEAKRGLMPAPARGGPAALAAVHRADAEHAFRARRRRARLGG